MKRFSLFVPALVGAIAACAFSASAGLVLSGNYLQVGVGGDGSLIDDGFVTGIKWDKAGTGNFVGQPDFLKPGTPWEMYSMNIGGVSLPVARYGAGNPYGFTSTDTSDYGAGKYQVVTQGTIAGFPLTYTSTLTFGSKSDHINITTSLANTSKSVPVTDIYFARGCDPDQDIDVGGGFPTHNVVSGNTVTAFSILNAFGNGTPWIAVWDLESKGVVGTWADWGFNNDAKALFQTPGGNGDADWEIYAAFYKASLAPAESITWQFDYIIPEPSQYAMLAGLGLVGFAAFRRFKKA